jgi:predicted secreted acid phosphatase
MVRLRITLVAAVATAALLAVPATAPAQEQIPRPKVITTTLGKTPLVELSDGGGGLPYLGSQTSYNAGDWETALATYHDSGVYERELTQVGRRAQAWVRRHAQRVNGKRPAIVLDVDETSLSNYTAIRADNFTFGPNSQAEAQNEVGTAIAPIRTLFRIARNRNVLVFFITGRRESVRAPTQDNLRREGYGSVPALVMKPTSSTATTVAYKSGARAEIERDGFRIIANVGDQYSDLAGGHAVRAFKLPNPFYFLP